MTIKTAKNPNPLLNDQKLNESPSDWFDLNKMISNKITKTQLIKIE
jgi:hypothetical protein